MPTAERTRAYRREQMHHAKSKGAVKNIDRALRAPKSEAYQKNKRNAIRAELNSGWWY